MYKVLELNNSLLGTYIYSDNYCKGFIKASTQDREIIVMQYTGLNDKNGKEIYEDDVVQTYFDNGNERMKVKVFFQNGRFELNNNSNEVKLIGNIYENPELLKND